MSMACASFPVAHNERPFWPRRRWWLALLGILVLAGTLRYPGYDFGLPYTEIRDESIFALSGQMIIDWGTAKPIAHHHYPPGIISIYYVLLRLFHDPTMPPTSVIGYVRLIAITMSLGVILLLGLFGYHAVGESAGLLGAALWSISPFFVEWNRWGTAETFVAFFSVLSMYLTFLGIRYQRGDWTTLSTYALMLAIVFKYHCAFIAPVVLFAPLWHRRVSWRRVWANTGRFALFCVWLLLFTPFLDAFFPSDPSTKVTWGVHIQYSGVPDPLNILHNIRSASAWFGWQFLFPGWLCLGLIFTDQMRQRRTLDALAFLGSVMILWAVGISFFGKHGIHAIRFLFTCVSLLVMLSGWGYALLLNWLYQYMSQQAPQHRQIAVSVAGILLLALQISNAWEAVGQSWQATLPDHSNELAHWADRTLPAGPYIAHFHSNAILNRDWGGYPGTTPFRYEGDVYEDTTIAEWRAQDVLFAIVSYGQYDLWREEGIDEFATQTTLLKSYPPSDAYRGPDMVVLLLHPIQHAATGQLGPIRLIGYDLPREKPPALAKASSFHLYWQARGCHRDQTIRSSTTCSTPRVSLITQTDGPPLPDPLLRRGTLRLG